MGVYVICSAAGSHLLLVLLLLAEQRCRTTAGNRHTKERGEKGWSNCRG
jgi:hypothetical protein